MARERSSQRIARVLRLLVEASMMYAAGALLHMALHNFSLTAAAPWGYLTAISYLVVDRLSARYVTGSWFGQRRDVDT